MSDDEEAACNAAVAPVHPGAAVPLWTLNCGKRVPALTGRLPVGCSSIADVPTGDLRFENFTVTPDQIEGWASMTKSHLKRHMASMRGELYRKEKERRLLLRLAGQPLRAATRGDAVDGSSPAATLVPGAKRARKAPADAKPSDGTAEAAGEGSHDASPGSGQVAKRSRAECRSDWLAAADRGIRVVLDCSFDHLMTAKEIVSLSMQTANAFAHNARSTAAAAPLRLLATSVNEERLLAWFRGCGLMGWGADIFQEHFTHVLRQAGWSGSGSSSAAAGLASSISVGVAPATAAAAAAATAAHAPLRDLRAQLPAILQSRRELLGMDDAAAGTSPSTAAADVAASTASTASSSSSSSGGGAVGKWAAAEPPVEHSSAVIGGAGAGAGAGSVAAVPEADAGDAGSSLAPAAAAGSGFVLPTAFDRLPPPQRVVYLSADADTVLRGPLDPGTVYVVGGIVDRNRHKGLTARVAAGLGIATARFPIEEEGVHLSGSTVLTTMHVIDILSRVAASGGDWGAALRAAIPQRKQEAATAAAAAASAIAAVLGEAEAPAASTVAAAADGALAAAERGGE